MSSHRASRFEERQIQQGPRAVLPVDQQGVKKRRLSTITTAVNKYSIFFSFVIFIFFNDTFRSQ